MDAGHKAITMALPCILMLLAIAGIIFQYYRLISTYI